jgi:hypothetical protein
MMPSFRTDLFILKPAILSRYPQTGNLPCLKQFEDRETLAKVVVIPPTPPLTESSLLSTFAKVVTSVLPKSPRQQDKSVEG